MGDDGGGECGCGDGKGVNEGSGEDVEEERNDYRFVYMGPAGKSRGNHT